MKNIIQLMLAFSLLLVSGFSNAQTAFNAFLSMNQAMEPGKFYYSPNGQYFVVFQPGDGNLVVYRGTGIPQNAIWNSGARYGTVAVLQGDANFVIYKGEGIPQNAVWNSQTGRTPDGSQTPQVRISDSGALSVVGFTGTVLWTSQPAAQPVYPCTQTPYPMCMNAGTPYQYGSWVMACSYQDAQTAAFMSGGRYGQCF